MAASIGDKVPDVFQLREIMKDDIKRALNEYQGKKDLVIDPELMRPLDRIAGAAFLKENGVDKIFKLDRFDKQKVLGGCDRRIYLVKPKINIMKILADQISTEQARGEKRSYRIIMVPRRLYLCEMVLEQEGVFGLCELDELHIELLPLDTDLLSMEVPEFFKSFYLDGDITYLQTISNSIHTLQQLMGEIPNVYCIGKAGKMCHELLKQLSGDKLIQPDFPRSEIGHLVLFDREADFVTPLCSQVTYEGLLDDMFGIQCGCVEFGTEITNKPQPVKVLLSSKDELFDKVRNLHFTNVFELLKQKAKELQSVSDKRSNLTSVSDMKDFVANDLRQLNQTKAQLAYHIGACEQIIAKKNKGDFQEYIQTEHSLLEGSALRENLNYIEESINKQNNLVHNLKLLCLMSLTNDGIPSREFKSLKTQFIQSHGYEQMLTFNSLSKVGLLREQEVTSQSKMAAGVAALTKRSLFRNLRKKLALIPTTDVDLRNLCDMSYVFSGAYTPLSCKLIEQCIQKEGFQGMEEVTKNLPGGVHHDVRLQEKKTPGSAPGRAAKVVLVFFIGGCSYSEIAALRFLGKQKEYQYIIATTSIVTGSSLLESVMEIPQL